MTDLKDDAWHWVEGWLGEQLGAEVPHSPCEGQFDAYVAGHEAAVKKVKDCIASMGMFSLGMCCGETIDDILTALGVEDE